MLRQVLIYFGSSIIFVWGVSHIIPTGNIVKELKTDSIDDRKIFTMEWIAEGLTLCFIGVLASLVTYYSGPGNPVAALVITALAAMLLIMATLTALTGARTAIIPMKICPYVKTTVAILFIAGVFL